MIDTSEEAMQRTLFKPKPEGKAEVLHWFRVLSEAPNYRFIEVHFFFFEGTLFYVNKSISLLQQNLHGTLSRSKSLIVNTFLVLNPIGKTDRNITNHL